MRSQRRNQELTSLLSDLEKQLDDATGVNAVEPPAPVDWAQQVSGLQLDPWQTDLLQSDSARELLLCARQVGKSEVVALKAAYEAAFNPGARILVLAPAQRQSSNLFDRIRHFLANEKLIRYTRTEIELANGSSLVCLPGDRPDFVRGFTASLVVIDESAYVRDSVINVMFPMLATTCGRLIMLSTPSGPRGAFYNAWMSQDNWNRVMVLADKCPRISDDFLDEAESRLGHLAYRQEYLCEFVQSADSFFSADLIAEAFGG